MAKKNSKGNFAVRFQLKSGGKALNGPMTAIVPNVGSETLAGNRVSWHARHIGLDVDILSSKATDAEATRLTPVRLGIGNGKASKKAAGKGAAKKTAKKAGKKASKQASASV